MGERRRKSGRRMEKSLWVRDVERVGEEWRKRSHMIGEVAGPDHGHQ